MKAIFQLNTIITLMLLQMQGWSQAPSIQWQKCLGGGTIDEAYSIRQISDGGYIVTGYTESNNGDVSGLHNSSSNYPDFWVVKLDNIGSIKWQKCLGSALNETANCVRQTNDGGFIIAGESNSNGGDVTGNHGQKDCWVVKLDSSGGIQWEYSYGGSVNDWAQSIQQTLDGGYIFCGSTLSNDGDVTGNHGSIDCWVVKLNGSGIVQWQKCFGGSSGESAYSIKQTFDTGYIFIGTSGAVGGDVTFNHGSGDYWFVKLDSLGNLKWQKSYGGSSSEIANDIIQTSDKGYIALGYSGSFDGDVTGNHAGSFDCWVLRTDSAGNIVWQKSLGGSMNDYGSALQQSSTGDFIIAAFTRSNDGDVNGNHGGTGTDGWICHLDISGNIIWQKCIGGTGDEYARDIAITTDGGAIITGNTNSNDGDVAGNHGGDDYWVVKLDNLNAISEKTHKEDVILYPNPANDLVNIESEMLFTEFRIFDVMGKLVKYEKDKIRQINVSDLTPGVYQIQGIYSGGMTTQRIMVQH